MDIKQLNCYDDFKNLCIGLETREEFKQKYGLRVFNRFYTLRRYGKISQDLEFPLPKISKIGIKKTNYSEFSTLEDYNNHVKDNNYDSPSKFAEKEPKLYAKMCKEGYSKLVNYSNRKRSTIIINNLEELQDLVTKENILSKTDLNNKYPGIYAKFCKDLSKITFNQLQIESLDEARFMKELYKYNIKFIYQYEFIDSRYRYDFLINSKYIIEIHGRQHFNPNIANDAWNKEENIQETDKIKSEYAKKHGIKVYYFTYCLKDYNKFGYFDKVFTNIDQLFSELKLDTSNIDLDFEIKFNNSISFEYNQSIVLSELNEFIKNNNIYTREELKKLRPDLYWKAVKFNLRSELDFCSWWTKEDVNKFVLENNLTKNKKFYEKFKDIYIFCKTNNLL